MDLLERDSLKLAEKIHSIIDTKERLDIVQNYIKHHDNPDGIVICNWPVGQGWLNATAIQQDDLTGKVVLLDFFTYCCINCIHMIPFVHKLESLYSVEDGLVVIGIHSAKFPNEKDSSNIENALQRYDISHPVFNDSKLELWNELSIKCWPTFVVLNPQGKILLSLPGEAYADVVELVITETMNYYKDKLNFYPLTSHCDDEVDGIVCRDAVRESSTLQLKYPGKVALDVIGKRLAIADTGNHRVIICSVDGSIIHVVGGKKAGRKDGDLKTCKFTAPQGLAWHGENSIYVADCGNHLIRKIDLTVRKVVTVAGTGDHGSDYAGGQQGLDQPICSPWDVQVAGSPKFPQKKNILYIAMSGLHQIWALFLQDADWQKGSEYTMGTCLRFAGNGQEENRNNSYPHKAGFAQPSALTVDTDSHSMYVGDSESSAIRRINLANGAVEPVAGGHFDPTNLFAFGDEDGKARNAKLQHPLGVAWDKKRSRLYIADSYNHKIKVVDPKTKICSTLCGPEKCSVADAETLGYSPVFDRVEINEPGGICLDPAGDCLYIADTNNHSIKMLNLTDGRLTELSVKLPSPGNVECDSVPATGQSPLVNLKRAKILRHDPVAVTTNDTIQMRCSVDDVILTEDAPSSWQLTASLRDDAKPSEDDLLGDNAVLVHSGMFRTRQAETSISVSLSDLLPPLLVSRLTSSGDQVIPQTLSVDFIWEANVYYCAAGSDLCTMKGLVGVVPIILTQTTKAGKPTLSQPALISLDFHSLS